MNLHFFGIKRNSHLCEVHIRLRLIRRLSAVLCMLHKCIRGVFEDSNQVKFYLKKHFDNHIGKNIVK